MKEASIGIKTNQDNATEILLFCAVTISLAISIMINKDVCCYYFVYYCICGSKPASFSLLKHYSSHYHRYIESVGMLSDCNNNYIDTNRVKSLFL